MFAADLQRELNPSLYKQYSFLHEYYNFRKKKIVLLYAI
jgi:hypothetical protein